jgi:hypothetical protein
MKVAGYSKNIPIASMQGRGSKVIYPRTAFFMMG